MIPKHFDVITKPDIEALVVNLVPEGKNLDYKDSLPDNTSNSKKEFLKDISSFANASGGDLIYGVGEARDEANKPTGVPNAANGLRNINADQEILRLDNLIRTGIAPRISGILIKAIPDFQDGPVIIIRIPKSWASPHMLTLESDSRFFSRTNAGKYPLDIVEIRSAFALSESLPEKVRRFRDDRLARIVADETPVPLEANPRIILHLLPITALDPSVAFDVRIFAENWSLLRPIGSSAGFYRYNFDGLVVYDGWNPIRSRAYSQVFRNGTLEVVNSYILGSNAESRLIPSVIFEEEIIQGFQIYKDIQNRWGILPPIFVMLSLIGVKGFRMAANSIAWMFKDSIHPIDRDVLLLPEILMDDFTARSDQILQPVLDAVWQSAGWVGSPHYRDGTWAVR